MSNSALALMGIAEGLITFFTIYFFYKVLTAPKKPEPDSFSEND